jgi:fucose permease
MSTPPARASARAAAAARIAVALIFFANGFAFASWVPHIPSVQARLGLSPSLLGLALFGAAVGGLIAMPLTGALIGRWGSRPITLLGSLLFLVLVALPVRAPSLPQLILALVAFGAANGVMDVAMNAQGVFVEQRLGRPIMSSLHALFSLGSLAGAGLSVVALKAGLTPPAHVALSAGFGLLLIAGAARWLMPTSLEGAGSSGPSFVLPRGPLLLLGVMTFLILLTEGAMADWSAVYLRHSLSVSPELAGAGYAMFSVTMAAGRLAGDRLVTAFGPAPLLRLGGLLAATGLGTALALHQPLAALVGFGCMGLGLSNIIPLLFSAAGRTPGVSPSMAVAAVSTTGYGGFLAGPPLIGLVADWVGLPLALGLLAAFALLVAAGATIVRPQAAAESPHAAA